eukprot:scaffold142047_cov37-Prasinocladus_malaysianus.AAC.2
MVSSVEWIGLWRIQQAIGLDIDVVAVGPAKQLPAHFSRSLVSFCVRAGVTVSRKDSERPRDSAYPVPARVPYDRYLRAGRHRLFVYM